ncbi:MAG: hypothetical protein HDR37_08650 [Treponema sp.]|nr:hypothetical protein [Treponema sp.]
MKKILFLWLICAFFAAAHSLEFKGFPTSVQINEDKSLLVLLNDDYDFSVYSVSVENGNLACERKSNLGKKDVSDTSYELDKSYAKKAEADCDVQEILGREKALRESEFLKKNGCEIGFYVNYSFYSKSQHATCCVYNFEDGHYIYETRILYMENNKVSDKKFTKGHVVALYELPLEKYMLVYYNFKKDKTRVQIIKNLKTLK